MVAGATAVRANLDQRDLAWYVDKLVEVLVFVGGISGIVFVIGIFVFIGREGLGFIVDTMDFAEFFTSPRWRPTSSARLSKSSRRLSGCRKRRFVRLETCAHTLGGAIILYSCLRRLKRCLL